MSNFLIGVWQTDPADHMSIQTYGKVELQFKKDGKLIYTILEKDKEQKALLTYTIEGDKLITDQLSSPKKEISEFIVNGNSLELAYGGI